MKTYRPNGFTMIDALLALVISLLVSFLTVLCIQSCKRIALIPFDQQDQIAILQLQQTMALVNAYEVQAHDLIYMYNHEEFKFTYNKHRLVKQKGYEIILENIDDAYFYDRGKAVYLTYKRATRTFTYQII